MAMMLQRVFGLVLLLIAAPLVQAGDAAEWELAGELSLDAEVLGTLNGTAPLQLPAAAAAHLRSVPAPRQAGEAIAVIRHVLRHRSAVVMPTTRTVAATLPEHAVEIALGLIRLEPRRTQDWLAAMTSGAPKAAAEILKAVVREMPTRLDTAFLPVAEQVPEQTAKLLESLAEAAPGMASVLQEQARRTRRLSLQARVIVPSLNLGLRKTLVSGRYMADSLRIPGVSGTDVAIAILDGGIVLTSAGRIDAYAPGAIRNSLLRTALETLQRQASLTAAVDTALAKPSTTYYQVWNSPAGTMPVLLEADTQSGNIRARSYSE